MCEQDFNGQQNNESASVEISEADFLDEAAREKAVKELCGMVERQAAQPPSVSAEDGAARPHAYTDDDGLERPHISAVRAVLNVTIPLIVAAALFCTLYFTLEAHRLEISLGVSLGGLGLYVLLRMRAILIWSIRVYQRFAPAEVRRRCVFTPTCSQYAIQALQKYGVIRGVPRIISRLLRCHLPNGGDDPLK